MAFTHIPLMPAGDVASGVETPRGLGTGNETFSGAAFFSLSLCRKYRFICNTKKKKKNDITESEEKCNQQFKGHISRWKQTPSCFSGQGDHEQMSTPL